MSRRRPKQDDFTNLAADHSPEDGGDPKEFHQKPWNAAKKAGRGRRGSQGEPAGGSPWSRKGQQLCQQVRDALHNAFAACGDVAVQAASIIAVEPAPHTGRLRVLVSAPPDVGREAVAEALARAAGHLRSEVATAISRRYAPELTFEVIEM